MTQNLEYTYEIINVNYENKFMEIIYNYEGQEPIKVGARIPYEYESLDQLVHAYSPTKYLIEESTSLMAVTTGTTGSYVIPEISFEETRDKKISELASWRYIIENNGVIVNGNYFSTSRESQYSLLNILNSMKDGFITTVNWKMRDNVFVELNQEQITNIIQTITNHVQLCFNREKYYIELINQATTIEELNQINNYSLV